MPSTEFRPYAGLRSKARVVFLGAASVLAIAVTAAFASIGADTPGRLMNDLARDFGLQGHQAAGIVGNFAVETGNFNHQQELNPTVAGSRGGYGMAQWTGPRRRQLESYAADRGMDVSSYEAQYAFLSHELNGEYASVVRQMQNAGSVEESTRIFMEQFERPGIPHFDKRLAYAMGAANGDFGDAGLNPQYGAGGGMGGTTEAIEQIPLVLMPWGAG